MPPGRDGAALCTAQRTGCCDNTQKKNQTKMTFAMERAPSQTKGGGTHIRTSARAYVHVHVPPGRDGAALCTAQRTGCCDSTQKKNQMKMAFATERAPPQTKGGGRHPQPRGACAYAPPRDRALEDPPRSVEPALQGGFSEDHHFALGHPMPPLSRLQRTLE